MTEISTVLDKPRFSDHDPRCDKDAFTHLLSEIQEVAKAGYEVSIGHTDDEAYTNPEGIEQTYEYLRTRDAALQEKKMHFLRSHTLGNFGLNPLKWNARRGRAIDRHLEPFRDAWLFGETETNSREWHNQRGRAAALLTIALAHEFATSGGEDSGAYDTMSGPLDEQVLDYKFPQSVEGFEELSLHDAIMKAEIDFGKRNAIDANERANMRLTDMRNFIAAPVTKKFKDVIQYCTDSLGIRSRKQEVAKAIDEYVFEQTEDGSRKVSDILMMSFGCGTALPMLEVMADLKKRYGASPKLILLDQDPLSLASAAVLAKKMGLQDDIEIHCKRLFSALGSPLDLKDVLGERKLDVAEDSGLREYLPDSIYTKLTRESWKSLRSGGLMTTGNMNTNRPQAEFLHGMMGWHPRVKMRHIADGFRLHEKAGIPKGRTRARVTRDGVYTLFFSRKAKEL